MRTDELTDWMHESVVQSSPDLARITAMGRRRQVRRRLVVASAGAGVLAAVAAPFVVVAQGDQGDRVDYATAPSTPEYRPAEPVGEVITDLNKFYLPGDAATSSRGPMSVWAEAGSEGGPSLHYGWKADDGVVRNVGTLVKPAALADGLRVVVVPSHRADLTEPTFVASFPVAPGIDPTRYAISVEGTNTQVKVRTHVDVVPGFVVYTFSPRQASGEVPDVYFLGLTGPGGVELGVHLEHDDVAWSTSPADLPGR